MIEKNNMKKYILGFIGALVLIGLVYLGYQFISGSRGSYTPVAPESLNPAAKEFGTLRVEVSGKGKPIVGLEVDLGQPGGRMTYKMTDGSGVAVFENVSVGSYDIFFNDINFPKEFARISSTIPVEITKDRIVEKNIILEPQAVK